MKDIIPFKKKIKGRLYITVSVPFETEVNAKYEPLLNDLQKYADILKEA